MRPIDADALIADIRKNSASYFADDFAHEWVDRQPTIELPEIIRCKDCKYRDDSSGFCHNPRWGDGYANYTPPTVPEDGFCMDGRGDRQ